MIMVEKSDLPQNENGRYADIEQDKDDLFKYSQVALFCYRTGKEVLFIFFIALA